MKIICLIQQAINSYKCSAMRTASELRTMNTKCTSICVPVSITQSQYPVTPGACTYRVSPFVLDAPFDDPTCMSGTIHYKSEAILWDTLYRTI